jgi:hypothetical protein
MAETSVQPKSKMPRGRQKGGTRFPRLNLEKALEYSKKLVSKTHTGPQPEAIILPGVFGNVGSPGKIRASALKQYGLLEGAADAYKAAQLAKDIGAATEGDRPALLQKSFLTPKLFNDIFQTFHGDQISKSKIEQRAKGLDVHPDSAAECAQLFIDSAVTAGLGSFDGESITLAKTGPQAPDKQPNGVAQDDETLEEAQGEASPATAEQERPRGGEAQTSAAPGTDNRTKNGRPGVNVNLTVDSSSDPDKLEKQLKLLRQFGMI